MHMQNRLTTCGPSNSTRFLNNTVEANRRQGGEKNPLQQKQLTAVQQSWREEKENVPLPPKPLQPQASDLLL